MCAWYINAPESIHLFCPSLPQAPGLSSDHDDGDCEDVVPWIGRYLRDEMIGERGIRIDRYGIIFIYIHMQYTHMYIYIYIDAIGIYNVSKAITNHQYLTIFTPHLWHFWTYCLVKLGMVDPSFVLY